VLLGIVYQLGVAMKFQLKSKVMLVVMLALGFVCNMIPSGIYLPFLRLSRLAPVSYIKAALSSQIETVKDVGVFSLVGATMFGSNMFLVPALPVLASHITGLAWCLGFLYVLAKNNGITKKVDAVHDDTQQLRKDTADIKEDTSVIKRGQILLAQRVDGYHEENGMQFKKLNGNVDNLTCDTQKQFGIVHTELGQVQAGIDTVGTCVGNIEKKVTQNTAELGLLRGQMTTLVGQGEKMNATLDEMHERERVLKNEIHAIRLQSKMMLEAQDRQNATISHMQSDVHETKDVIVYLGKREQEREQSEQRKLKFDNGGFQQRPMRQSDDQMNIPAEDL
jgi:hypothetical protein